MNNNVILVCDDDHDIVRAIQIYLEDEGYKIVVAGNGLEAVQYIEKDSNIKLAILDIMMPVMDGHEACKKIREKSNIPIIFLTAMGQDEDKIQGLELGADDYITKPFNPSMLVARVKSALRRYTELGSGKNSSQIVVGGLCIDLNSRKAFLEGEEIIVTPTEFKILQVLMETPGKVNSAREIYSAIWNNEPVGADSTIAVHIRHLREKFEIDPAHPRYFKVIWGQGYKIDKE